MTSSTYFEMRAQIRRQATTSMAVAVWLYGVAALIFVMVIVGGATRLTDSGLSITEWQPILGVIPPLSEADWQAALEKYRQIPQYQLINRGMSLEDFKVIYWWEWAHRFLGRIIGLAFFVPLVWFWVRGQLSASLKPKLLALLFLGGLQGFLGWYMVQSGLTERVDVSQYRLAAHLGLAIVIFGAILWLALGLSLRRNGGSSAAAASTPRWALAGAIMITAFIFLQIVTGAFVAGLDAGRAHNTWPLMDGYWLPPSVGEISPWYRDMFENVSTVQFNHRVMAYVIVLLVIVHAVRIWRAPQARHLRLTAMLLVGGVLVQSAFGIWTVIAAVPLWLGLVHQAGAAILFGLAILHLRVAHDGRRAAQGTAQEPTPAMA
jgi:cytochrome c oxidase assembly protein subunit 15